MTSVARNYSLEQEIATFFSQTTTTREECDARAKQLVGGEPEAAPMQGVCSYTVYAGPGQETSCSFASSHLSSTSRSSLLQVKCMLGDRPDGTDGKEPVLIYVMDRVKGISFVEFILAREIPMKDPEWQPWRKNLIGDKPEIVGHAYRNSLQQKYEGDLRRLLTALPERFHSTIQETLDALPDILRLPMALVHKDLGMCNIMVDLETCYLVGVVDWAEAEIAPFGTNFHSLHQIVGHLHFKSGWDDLFWDTLQMETGYQITDETVQTIKAARVLGCFQSHGFTPRLANMPPPEPIKDDEKGRYQMLYLDGMLLNPATKFI
ncbi:hypothetical protein QBC46DRAFT_457973 [Diplogelasinospora grovesii]|uniref:Aminoglycoside phosphotransferase domain-containing protein n=1 Tax=Diplogelasinospora grovesii TaxID=303347 RepID=A0AAN6NB49_9PEZI|nr:hypothetical protein QBC46DRAFT_457973 [Diplogelasinospora grovesii]